MDLIGMSKTSTDATVRTPKRIGYTVVPNGVLPEGKISARSWGLYVYLLSRPPGWEIRTPQLQKVFSEGRDAIYTALKELVDVGLMELENYLSPEKQPRRRYVMVAPEEVNAPSESSPICPNPEKPDPGNPYPEKPWVTTTDINQAGTEPLLNPFTPEQDSGQMLHPHSYERGSENKKSAGELADPISPAWYASQDRQIILSNIQAIAKAKTAKDPVKAAHLVEALHDNLCKAFNSDGDGIDGLIWDYNWEPKKPQADRKQAAIWLNKLIGKWKGYTEVTWRGPTG